MGFLFHQRQMADRYDPQKVVKVETPNPFGWTVVCILILVLLAALIVAGAAGCKAYNRAQKRADANNAVKVTHIQIRNAQQQADVVKAQNARVAALAQQRIIAAHGLAEAQRIIHSTLTPLYVQFEAIEAQKAIAISGRNNTVIYVPSGANGAPVITQDVQGLNKEPAQP